MDATDQQTSGRLPLHSSLIGPIQLYGGDRRLVIPLWTVVVIFLFPPWSVLKVGVGLLIAVVGHALIIWMGKEDVWWVDIYLRSLTYQDHYHAGSSQRAVVVRESIPR